MRKKRKREKKHRFARRTVVFVWVGGTVVLLNGAAWDSTAFSDWYIAHIFPFWVSTYGRLTGLFPFSVGEWMIAAGAAAVLLAAVLGVLWAGIGILTGIRRAWRRLAGSRVLNPEEGREREKRVWRGFRRFSRGFFGFFTGTLLFVSLIMTLNCFILYHGSTFSAQYFGEDEGDYSLEELIAVYNMVAEQCNLLAQLMVRDDAGMVLYEGCAGEDGTVPDMADTARELMGRLGETYLRLKGYYPRPKALLSSDFMCQQHMQGYYFPFSMEANYNDVMHILNIPATMCHELAHLRGYIYEDEANFIGYLACVQSEDPFFRYAGYLSVLVYLNNDIYYAWRDNRAAYESAAAVTAPVTVEEQVWTDNIFVTEEEWDRINGKALIDTEIVDKAADVFIDANLKLNGVSDGKVSYSRVVKLLLQYYRREGLPDV